MEGNTNMAWTEKIARLLDPTSYRRFDERRELLQSKDILITELKGKLIESQKQLEAQYDDFLFMESKYTQLKQNGVKKDLSKFKSNKTYKFNGVNKKPNTWLNDKEDLAVVTKWVNDNLDISILTGTIDEKAKQLRYMLYDHFGSKDIWEADKVQNTFSTCEELIERDFKGNCNDWFRFVYKVYEAVFGKYNRLYCVMGGLNLAEGWNQGNHAYCLWEHSDENFYVIESAVGQSKPWNTYIQASLDAFGSVPQQDNFRYGRIVWMFNTKETYYQVLL